MRFLAAGLSGMEDPASEAEFQPGQLLFFAL